MSKGLEMDQLAAQLRDLELRRQEGALDAAAARLRQELLGELIARLQRRPGAERRKHIRIPADLEVRFRLGEASITCHATELSYGGIGLKGHLWIMEDQLLVVENMRMGHRDYPLSLRAKVIWKISDEDRQPGAGLIFLQVDESALRQIQAIFEHLFIAYLDRLATLNS